MSLSKWVYRNVDSNSGDLKTIKEGFQSRKILSISLPFHINLKSTPLNYRFSRVITRMSANPKAQLAANVGTVVGATVTLTTAAVAAGTVVGSMTGRGLTKIGSKRMADARDFLYQRHADGADKGEFIVPDAERQNFQRQEMDP